MTVNLIAYTPEPEKVVAAAAKLCYSQSSADDIMAKLDHNQAAGFLEKLMDFGHYSPLEHVSFTFAVDGVSRVLTHQLVRHRIASYSQQSQRYVKFDQFEYIMPPAIENSPEAKEIFIKAMSDDQESYSKLVAILEVEYKLKNIEAGMSEKKAVAAAEKSAIEDARFVFPNACETKIVMTMNARSLINFFNHRCCNRAQWEIRALADEILKAVKGVAPSLFAGCGPKCVTGPCPEGKMTCGSILEVRKKYSEL
ncbi:FAD-dependent thymidylate synthase [Fusibacter bizertensis]